MSHMIYVPEDDDVRRANHGRVVMDDGTVIRLAEDAEPTGRVLPHDDPRVEWAARGTRISDGAEMRVYWIHDCCPDASDPESWDWDATIDRAVDVG